MNTIHSITDCDNGIVENYDFPLPFSGEDETFGDLFNNIRVSLAEAYQDRPNYRAIGFVSSFPKDEKNPLEKFVKKLEVIKDAKSIHPVSLKIIKFSKQNLDFNYFFVVFITSNKNTTHLSLNKKYKISNFRPEGKFFL